MTRPTPARYIQRPLDEAQVARHWDGIQKRLEAKQRRSVLARRRWAWTLGLTGAAAAGVLVTLFVLGRLEGPKKQAKPSVWNGAVIESGSTGQSLTLTDGSTIQVAPRTRIELCEEKGTRVCVRVDRGKARFSVRHNPNRPFVVKASDVEVRVAGTRFTVEHRTGQGADWVVVTVERGIVEVSGPNAKRRLTAGQRWSMTLERTPGNTAAASNQPPGSNAGTSQQDASAPESRGHDDKKRLSRPHPVRLTADKLWKQAQMARRQGQYKKAARLFGTILKRFPHDSQAALAAFTLGRIRMDALGNPRGAIGPLKRALAAGPGRTFYEDALARLARAYHRIGRQEACQRIHRRYLARYPHGVHRATLARICSLQPTNRKSGK